MRHGESERTAEIMALHAREGNACLSRAGGQGVYNPVLLYYLSVG